MNTDHPYLGVLLMLGFCLLAPLSDAIAKYLTALMSLGQLVTVRFTLMAVILVPLLGLTSGIAGFRLPARVLWLSILRASLHLGATACFFAALVFLPLADALAIAFVLPFLMLIAGRVFLGEEVGRRRITACSVGFLGTLMVIQPNFANVGWPALLPLAVAVLFTAFMLVTRVIAQAAHPLALQAVSGLASACIMVPLFALGATLDLPGFEPNLPDARSGLLLLLLGGLATAAHLLMTWSLRFAPAATLAPVQYAEIPVAAVVGWLIFRDLPNGLAALGILVTMAAGIYILARERALSRSAPPPIPQAPTGAG